MNRTTLLLSTALLAVAIAGAPNTGLAQGQAQPPAPQAQGADKSSEDHKAHHPTDATTAQAAPGTTAPAPAPAVPGQGGAGQAPAMGMMGGGTGMMGGDMGAMMQRMMPMMRGMMAQRGMERMDGPMGMMAPRRVEGRIAFLRTELQITEAQTPAWNAFADVLRAQARGMEAMRSRMMGGGAMPAGQMPAGPMPGAQAPGSPPSAGQMPGGQMQAGQAPGRPMPGAGMGMAPSPGGAVSFPDHADQVVQMLTATLETARATATSGRALYAVLTDTQKKTADELLAMPMRGM